MWLVGGGGGPFLCLRGRLRRVGWRRWRSVLHKLPTPQENPAVGPVFVRHIHQLGSQTPRSRPNPHPLPTPPHTLQAQLQQARADYDWKEKKIAKDKAEYEARQKDMFR